MSFEKISHGSFSFWVYRPWWAEGVLHGFAEGGVNLASSVRASATETFMRDFGADSLHLLKQAHTDKVVTLSSEELADNQSITRKLADREADGIVIENLKPELRSGLKGFGVVTADCMPILIRSGSVGALVHSGWRGLANRIIIKTLSLMSERSPSNLEVLIGPCAGSALYEVGNEVIEAIGKPAVFSRLSDVKAKLDMQASAHTQISQECGDAVKIELLRQCTLSDKKYHSFRRDGEKAGRNLSFLIF